MRLGLIFNETVFWDFRFPAGADKKCMQKKGGKSKHKKKKASKDKKYKRGKEHKMENKNRKRKASKLENSKKFIKELSSKPEKSSRMVALHDDEGRSKKRPKAKAPIRKQGARSPLAYVQSSKSSSGSQMSGSKSAAGGSRLRKNAVEGKGNHNEAVPILTANEIKSASTKEQVQEAPMELSAKNSSMKERRNKGKFLF